MQTVIDNQLINYEVYGSNRLDEVLILHGWGRNLNDWTDVAHKLKDYKVIVVDLPGFGNSSANKEVYDTYLYAEFVGKFINKLKLRNLTLIGHSFGGKVGTIVAAKDKNIKKLVLIDASGIGERNIFTDIKILISKFAVPFTKFLPRIVRNHIFKKLASEDYKNAGPLRETFKKIISQNIEREAALIKVPTLIIWGDKDTEVSLNSAKKFKFLIPNSTLRIVWNAGHDPFREKPNKFMEILEEFI